MFPLLVAFPDSNSASSVERERKKRKISEQKPRQDFIIIVNRGLLLALQLLLGERIRYQVNGHVRSRANVSSLWCPIVQVSGVVMPLWGGFVFTNESASNNPATGDLRDVIHNDEILVTKADRQGVPYTSECKSATTESIQRYIPRNAMLYVPSSHNPQPISSKETDHLVN